MFKKFFGSKKEDKPVEEVSVDPNDVEFETASLTDLENNPDFKIQYGTDLANDYLDKLITLFRDKQQ